MGIIGLSIQFTCKTKFQLDPDCMNFQNHHLLGGRRKPTTFAPAAELERNYLQLKDGILASILMVGIVGVLLMENTPWKGESEIGWWTVPFWSWPVTGRHRLHWHSLGFLIAELKEVTGIL